MTRIGLWIMNDLIVISQGPADYVAEVEAAWAGVAPVIHSTWVGEHKPEMRHFCLSIKAENPGRQNVFMQQRTTLNGLTRAKAMGYKRAIKLRSDLIPTNASEFVKLLDGDFSFLYWHDHTGGYLVDYFQYGKIDGLIDLWSFEEEPEFPEMGITKNFIARKIRSDCGPSDDVRFVGQYLDQENDLLWLKRNVKISDYNKDPLYKNETP